MISPTSLSFFPLTSFDILPVTSGGGFLASSFMTGPELLSDTCSAEIQLQGTFTCSHLSKLTLDGFSLSEREQVYLQFHGLGK